MRRPTLLAQLQYCSATSYIGVGWVGRMTALQEALATIDEWADEVLVGQLFSVSSGRHVAKDIMGLVDESDDVDLDAILEDYIKTYYLGGIIYFPPGGDHESVHAVKETVDRLQKAAWTPLIVSTDQENGTVARIRQEATHFPGAMALGAADDEDLWINISKASAKELRAVGIYQTFAPIADLNVISENPSVGVRSPGADAKRAAKQVAATTKGLQEAGVGATLKHFPGLGSAAVDPHLGLPTMPLGREEWQNTEALVFEAGIEAGAGAVMIAHIVFPAVDPEQAATFSYPVITELLRNEFGFEGVIVTDAMDMGGAEHPDGPGEACVAALAAGVDQILMPADLPEAYEATVNALKEGRLDREQLRKSAKRILQMKINLGVGEEQPPVSVVGSKEHVDLSVEAARKSLTARDPKNWKAALKDAKKVALVHMGDDPQKRGENPAKVLVPFLEDRDVEVVAVPWGPNAASGLDPDVDHLVVVLRDAWREEEPASEILAQIAEVKVPLTVVATRSTHEASGVSADHPVLFTYGDSEHALRAAAEAMLGDVEPTGTPPIEFLSLEDVEGVENS